MIPARRRGRNGQRAVLLGILAGTAVAAAACGGAAAGSGSGHPATTGSGSGQAAVVSTHPTSLGTVLAGPNGRTVYLFEKDKGMTSACDGKCASLWPPVTTASAPTAAAGAQAGLLGTTRRGDGSLQVTYAGHPLYYFAGDSTASDVHGEGLKNFGAGWYVLSAHGAKVDND